MTLLGHITDYQREVHTPHTTHLLTMFITTITCRLHLVVPGIVREMVEEEEEEGEEGGWVMLMLMCVGVSLRGDLVLFIL